MHIHETCGAWQKKQTLCINSNLKCVDLNFNYVWITTMCEK